MTEITASETICKNCNQTFTKHYCNGCGQKKASRITNAHLVHEIMHVALHADKGIFPFIQRLILSPGLMAREFADGKRKIFNPIQFLVLSLGFVILLMSLTHFYENIELWQSKNLYAAPPNMKAMQEKLKGFNTFIQKNGNIIILILMPIFAFFSKLLFNKKDSNYAEHLMIIVFALSLSNVITGAMLLTSYFIGFSVVTILVTTFIITVTSLGLTYKQYYKIKWFTAFWKSTVVYSLTMLVQIILSAIISAFILILT